MQQGSIIKVQLNLSCDGIRIFHTTVHEQDEMLHKTDGLSGLQQSTSQPVTHTPAALRILVFVIKAAVTMQVIGPGGHVNDKIEIGRISLLLQACVGNCPLSMSQAWSGAVEPQNPKWATPCLQASNSFCRLQVRHSHSQVRNLLFQGSK